MLKRARLLCSLVLCVYRAAPSDSPWCSVCGVCRLTVDWVDCRCFLSFVFLGGGGLSELSPCDTEKATEARHPPERQYNACVVKVAPVVAHMHMLVHACVCSAGS